MKYLFFIVISGLILLMKPEIRSDHSLEKEKTTVVFQAGDTIHITDHKYFNFSFCEPGFKEWLARQEPMSEYYESSLEIKNMQYVHEWNRRVANPSIYDHKLYSRRIEYRINPKRRYGLEVNYKLYMFFIYFEQKHEQLLSD